MNSLADGYNPEHLPPSAKEMAEIIGLPALQNLVEKRGGVAIDVPKKKPWDAKHPITQSIGEQAAHKLWSIYQGERLEIPRCKAAIVKAIHARIIAERQKGQSETAVALKYHVSARWVRYLCARENESSQQAEMFGGDHKQTI